MPNEKYEKKLKFIINLISLIAVIGIIYFFLKYALFWVLPFIIAFAVCLLVEPLIRLLTNKLKWKRSVISTLVISVLLVILIALTTLLSKTVYSEAKSMLRNLDQYFNQTVDFIRLLPEKYGHLFGGKFSGILEELVSFLESYNYMNLLSGSLGGNVLKYAGNIVTSLPSAIIFLIVTIVATYFMAASFPTIKAFILRQFKPKTKELILAVKFHFINTIVKYLKSYFVLMMITFAELSVAFLIFGYKPAVPLAFVISIVDILPILGVGTVLIPWSVITLLLGNPVQALIIIGIYLVVTIVRQTLEPKVIGDHVGLPPIVTLFCIYCGLQLFGVLGMFLFPITVIILKNLQDSGHIKIWK